MMEAFSSYQRRATAVARKVFAAYPQHALDEQAGPAYLEGMALSRWAFWRRLAVVASRLPASGATCLDFGCGLGIMLPMLRRRFATVRGVDLTPEAGRRFLKHWDADYGESHGDVVISPDLKSTGLADGSVDLILALDVLEHVDQLEETLEPMRRLLRPDGKLVVCGPTENWIYKLGRRIVGFSGEYHHRGIADIERAMQSGFAVRTVKRMFYPFTLFVVLEGTPRVDASLAKTG
jgi:2-polyprenyl-3-methyl-5-hydroxy-6-metoxy-1,4-benzoquinol methylase